MKRTKNILSAIMYVSIIIVLSIIAIFETETMLPGDLAASKSVEFLSVSLMEAITICLIPMALRLFRFNKIKMALQSAPEKKLLQWGSIRLAMLCIPMLSNTLLYYLFMNVTFGYMAIVGLICLIFVNPTMARCTSETSNQK